MTRFIPRSLRLWLLFVVVAALSHILTTFWLAGDPAVSKFDSVTEKLPRNRFSVLQPISPETQLFPFMMPEAHYAICPFDASSGPVLLDVHLEDVGWILSVHASDGSVVYYAPGLGDRQLNLRLLLSPPGDQFLGLPVNGIGGDGEIPEFKLDEPKGLAILRAPLYGRSYAAMSVNALKRSSCRLIRRIPPRARTAERH